MSRLPRGRLDDDAARRRRAALATEARALAADPADRAEMREILVQMARLASRPAGRR